MGSWDEPELIGVEQAQTSTTEVRGGAGGGGKAFAALIVLCALGLFALQRTAADPKADPDQQETTGETVPEDSTTTTPTTSSRAPQPTTTEAPVISGDGALFSYDTGWDLIIGGEGPLTLLDVDSGAQQEFGRGKVPIGVVNDLLLMSNTNSQRIGYLRLSELDGSLEFLDNTMMADWPVSQLIKGPDDGTVWLPAGDYENRSWQLWDFNGEPTALREVPSPTMVFGPSGLHPEIIGSPAGGVFQFVGDRLERVADGRLMSVTSKHVVVEQCVTPFDCATLWLDRDTWQVDSQIRTPEIQNPYFLFGMVVSPDGQRAFIPDFETGRGFLWNLETGAIEHEGFIEGGSFSPDGRYAAGMLQNRKLAIIDTETGEVVEWDAPNFDYYARVVFVAS